MKLQILTALKEETLSRLRNAEESYRSALEHSQSEEMKSEGKYDTRGIEAGYLASAKKQRVDELKKQLIVTENLIKVHHSQSGPSKTAALGSLLLLEEKESLQWRFLSPAGGGSSVRVDEKEILIISAQSPIGSQALGLSEGDSFEVETPKETRDYLICRIL